MPTEFDIYVRQSGDESDASPEMQETACREYAAAQGWDVGEIVIEANTSSILPADERGLGFLIQRCEAGESSGIICRHLDRFGRSVGEGSLAYKRISDAGARLVAVADGLDSSRDGSKLQFTLMLAFAEQVYDRNRSWFLAGKERAVARGVYGAPAPFGYDRNEDGCLVPNAEAEAVRIIFRLRAEGVGFSEIARQIDGLTRSGVRRVVMNRAYVGEQRIPDPNRKGEPKTIRGSHRPLVTEQEWEAANAMKGRAPTHTGLGSETQLKGIVRCGICGSTMHVSAYGKQRDRRTYACTSGCGGTSMAVSKVEPAVLWMLGKAVADRAPHVAAVIEGDNRYADALATVESAKQALSDYRDDIEMQRVLGMVDFAAGLRVRKEAVETARRALRDVPRPAPLSRRKMTLAEFDLADRRRFYARVIAEVQVFPRSNGERLFLRWQGTEEAIPVPPFVPVDLNVLAAKQLQDAS